MKKLKELWHSFCYTNIKRNTMGKIKDFFIRIAYALPFGLKGADTEIMGSNDTGVDESTITQEVSDERVAKHLLKGEVTQEVEELRYRTYKVSNESEKYEYVGNGIALKNDSDDRPRDRKKIRFHQENNLLCESIMNEFKHMNDYGFERYRLEMTYNDIVRFKLEQFATSIDVFIDNENKVIETTLNFEKQPNPYNKKSKPFIKELEKLKDIIVSDYQVSRNEILSSIQTISFVTYKADNEDDLVTYCFVDNCKFKSLDENEFEFKITYTWDSYMRMPVNLEEKYFSPTMEEKYRNKERKDVAIEVGNLERKRYCSVCGKEMSTYDGDIQEFDGGVVICQDCLKKGFK